MMIRRLTEQDAQAVSELIITTIRISNVGDYSAELMEELVKTQTPELVMQRASWTHFYVAEDAGAIIGCGAIGPYWGKEDESSRVSIFVRPDCQGKASAGPSWRRWKKMNLPCEPDGLKSRPPLPAFRSIRRWAILSRTGTLRSMRNSCTGWKRSDHETVSQGKKRRWLR